MSNWSPEELVKQLCYPTDPCLPGNRGLMRDAADEIGRLRAELAAMTALAHDNAGMIVDAEDQVAVLVRRNRELGSELADAQDRLDARNDETDWGSFDAALGSVRQEAIDMAAAITRLRAEMAEAKAFATAEHAAWQNMNDRREIAEAEIDRLRAELAEQERVTRLLEGALKGEQDRIARVRELCDDPWRHWNGDASAFVARFLAALEGNQR